jgi:hypothetical protein
MDTDQWIHKIATLHLGITDSKEVKAIVSSPELAAFLKDSKSSALSIFITKSKVFFAFLFQ